MTQKGKRQKEAPAMGYVRVSHPGRVEVGKIFLTMAAGVAEMERNLIVVPLAHRNDPERFEIPVV